MLLFIYMFHFFIIIYINNMNNLIIFFILLIIIILLNYNNNIEKFRCRDSPTYDCSNYVDYHLGGGYRGRAANQCLWKNRSLSGRRPCLECPQSCGEADTQAWCDRASWCTSASECLETPLCCPCTDNQVISEGKCTNLLCNQGSKTCTGNFIKWRRRGPILYTMSR